MRRNPRDQLAQRAENIAPKWILRSGLAKFGKKVLNVIQICNDELWFTAARLTLAQGQTSAQFNSLGAWALAHHSFAKAHHFALLRRLALTLEVRIQGVQHLADFIQQHVVIRYSLTCPGQYSFEASCFRAGFAANV